MEVTFLCGEDVDELARFCRSQWKDVHTVIADRVHGIEPTAGVRAVINVVVEALNSHQKVAVLDNSLNITKLQSYVSVIKKKVLCQFKCFLFRPKFDKLQKDIVEEFRRSRCILNDTAFVRCPQVDDIICPDVMVEKVEHPPVIELSHKLEIPAVFVQFSALFQGNNIETRAVDALKRWLDNCRCGFVIVISHKSEDPGALRAIFDHVDRALYLYEGQFSDYQTSGSPGMIALLIPLLHLDVNDPCSRLVYHSQDFRQMAEVLGIKHCSAAKLWKSPGLINSSSAFTNPLQENVVLKSLVVRRVECEAGRFLRSGSVVSNDFVAKSWKISDTVRLHVLAKNQQCLARDIETYVEHCTPVDVDGSGVRDLNLDSRRTPPQNEEARRPRSGRSERSRLPDWLITSAKSHKKPKLDKNVKLETEYVMDEDEMLNCAEEYLKNSATV